MNYLDKVEHLSFGQCVKGAWRDAWRSVLNRPAASRLAFAYMVVCAISALVLPVVFSVFPVETAGGVGYVLAGPFVFLFQFMVSCILAVQAMRYVVLGADEARTRDLLKRGFWRYVWLRIVTVLPLVIALGLGTVCLAAAAWGGLLSLFWWALLAMLFAAGLFVYVTIRLMLLFCHVSIGGSTRWRAAWRDTRGHFWRFFAVSIVVMLPAIAVLVVGRLLVSISFAVGELAYMGLFAFVAPLASLAMGVQAASCSAWLYRRYANEIRE